MSTTRLLSESDPNDENHLYYESTPTHDKEVDGQDYLLFMITGNPGLISYYEPFLSTLNTLLSSSPSRFYISGHSLAGFDLSQEGLQGGSSSLVGLQGQILHIEEKLFKQVENLRNLTGQESPKVILMGHSVGAYILLELIREHHTKIIGGEKKDFDLIGGILLFPTITHIAKSQQGMIYSIILKFPHLPYIAAALVQFLFYLLPTAAVSSIVKWVMHVPEHAARTTASFIKSAAAVRQALYLAKDEMQTITEDKWGEEVWGAATSPGTNCRDTAHSNLYLYWGKHDQLVADKTRDKLIADRASKGTGGPWEHRQPKMFIDELGVPHAFCLKHSEIIAEKVKLWVETIIHDHNHQCSSEFPQAS